MENENSNVKYSSSKMIKNKTREENKSWFYYPLFLLFGIGTWLNLNGIWIELPILVSVLPEKWSLSPDLGLASNIANVGPLIIALIRYLLGKSSSYEIPSIILIFLVGIFGPLLLSLTWSKTLILFGVERSVYMLLLGFCLALVNCTSSVTYLPFVNRFPSKWLNFYFAGESLSSLIPAALGFIQGLTDEVNCNNIESNISTIETKLPSTRFSIETYFVCLSLLMFISFMAFILLCKFQPKKNEKNSPLHEEEEEEEIKLNEKKCNEDNNLNEIDLKKEEKGEEGEEKFNRLTMIYLGIIFWTSILLIGCIPSMNSYSLNPYGSSTFHYVIILCQCCYPLVSLLSTLFPRMFRTSPLSIILSTILGTVAFIYTFISALKSPCSPFVDEEIGKYLITFAWICVYLIFYYERISLGNYLNQHSGHRGLFWYGLLTQAGAFFGAVVIFTLTKLNTFQERDFCRQYKC